LCHLGLCDMLWGCRMRVSVALEGIKMGQEISEKSKSKPLANLLNLYTLILFY